MVVVGGVGEAPEAGVPTVCRQRHDAMVQHGAAAEQDVTPIGVGVAELATAVSVEMHALPADPPMPRLGVLGGAMSNALSSVAVSGKAASRLTSRAALSSLQVIITSVTDVASDIQYRQTDITTSDPPTPQRRVDGRQSSRPDLSGRH